MIGVWPSFGQVADPQPIALAPGASTKVDVPAGVRKIFISNPSVVDARPDDDGYAVLITGIRQGESEVRVSRISREDIVYAVTVEPEIQDLADQVGRMLVDVEGISVKIVGDQVVLDGELMTKGSMRRAQEVADAFQGQVLNLTKLDEATYGRSIKKALEREIGLDTVEISVDGDRFMLMGTVPSQAEMERVKEIAKKRADNVTIMLQVEH
jgi:pilus assembly protein CpaC